MIPSDNLAAATGLTSVQMRVLSFAQRELKMPARKVTIDARLRHDLGLSGRRAENFIRAFSQEFQVNFDALFERDEWTRYFGPERFPKRLPIFLCACLLITAMIFGGQLDAQWLWLIAVVGVWLARSKAWPMGRGTSDMLPLTLLDLAEAVEQGAWVKPLR